MKSSSVCAQEPEKITKTKWKQYCGTPCSLSQECHRVLADTLLLTNSVKINKSIPGCFVKIIEMRDNLSIFIIINDKTKT